MTVGTDRLRVLVLVLAWCLLPLNTAISLDFSTSKPGVAYHPRSYVPDQGTSQLNEGDIIKDIRLLKSYGFRSIVTYASNGLLGLVPELARTEGFDGVIIMGIWNPSDDDEWTNALKQRDFVDGYCVGNEGLGIRYHTDLLEVKMEELRSLSGRPVTTSERVEHYIQGSFHRWLLDNSDWLFPLCHPFWHEKKAPEEAVNWTVALTDFLVATTGMKLILKEVGLPTAGSENCSENSQLAFFKSLEATGVSFFYFEAFDQPWKIQETDNQEVEGHWGLFREDGSPKKVINWCKREWSN